MENTEINTNTSLKFFPMNGGEGPYSYANNSSYQKRGIDSTKTLIYEEIIKKYDMKQPCSSSKLFKIADMGCSVGPNTFVAVQNIIEAVVFKLQSQGLTSKNLEFQVFFNDHIANDFNTLFKSLPPERIYFAACAPGSFYGRLFPKASMHFVHSSYAVQWLSTLPNEVHDKNSPAWNKGRIIYGSKEVEKAYAAQFVKDVESFLNARAEEIVYGGFMALLLPSTPNGADPSKYVFPAALLLLGSTLMDMANMGLVDEAEVDSFNLPMYFASPAEVEALIDRNGCFMIERVEEWVRPTRQESKSYVEQFALVVRAGLEVITREHFGNEIIDELFNRYTEKLIDCGFFSDSSDVSSCDLFVLLRCVDECV